MQLRREFGFRDAAAIAPYLVELGVTHVYCSPALQAVPGSAHGYDVVDHSRLNDELGGSEGWDALVAACHTHDLGLVVDIVPNHMAVPTPESLNAAFWDVLRLGRDSAFADWFDIDWDVHGGKLLIPVLGRRLAEAISAGEIDLDADDSVVRYFDHVFPLAPGTDALAEDVAAVLGAQHYQLAHWREASTALNYRRFFDVTSLIGLRVERPDVFDATHSLVLELTRRGDLDGLRIDHPDGLADPRGYLDRLAQRTGGAWTVVEKILEPGELLPVDWPTAGTTGYDAIAAITHLLLDPAGERPLTELYADLTESSAAWGDVVRRAKSEVVDTLFGAEVDRLVRELGAPTDMRAAVVELLVALDVYRAYAGDEASRQRLQHARDLAAARRPDLSAEVASLAAVLADPRDDDERAFATRFEQTTGPVMAKGVEDTAFYRYHRLVALNEVGGDPGMFGLDLEAWHRRCGVMAEQWPTSMTTLTTHDTKRSEDVRARLLVLAEVPDAWRTALLRWREPAARHEPVDNDTDHLFWQTLVGAWPLTPQRMTDYLLKASREAKQHTTWLDPDEDYERRLTSYAQRVMDDIELMRDVETFVASLEPAATSNVLSQKLLQLTMPGVADVYQGQELADRSLVDPDNRRPVDYDERRRRLASLEGGQPAADPKLLVTATALGLRRARPDTFLAGGYEPVQVVGEARDHAVAYRRAEDVIAVATRLPTGLARRGGWGETRLVLPDGEWTETVTGEPASAALATLLRRLPVALLSRVAG